MQLSAIGDSLADGRLTLAGLHRVSGFIVTHTLNELFSTLAIKEKNMRHVLDKLITALPKKGQPPRLFLLDHQGREIFVEPLLHPGTIHLAGAGHVALAVARLAAFVGFDIVVMDDRAEFANVDRYPEAREVRVLWSFTACLENLGQDDYVVIVTRGHLHDRDVLAQALRIVAEMVQVRAKMAT